MNLTIDIGNTSTKIVVFEDTMPVYREAVKKLTAKRAKFLCNRFRISHSILSAVTTVDKSLVRTLRTLTQFTQFSSRTIIPVKNKYAAPEKLGSDRLANAIAAAFLFPKKNVLVIDAGTCIKYDFINSKNEYLGGSILPGLMMRFKAMHEFTGKLPLLKPAAMKSITGRTTQESMNTGVLIGIQEEMNGFVSRYKSEYSNLKVILTGGDAHRFAGELKLSIFAAVDLANIGLNEVLRFSRSKKN